MGIIDSISKKKTSAAPETDAKEEPKKKAVKKTATKAASPKKAKVEAGSKDVQTDAVKIAPATLGGNSWRVLATPRVSEKAAMLASHGTYVFNVPLSSNKVEIRKAVEALYGVHVASVRTVRGIGKMAGRGRVRGQRSDWKKALVTLKSGEKIELYQGV